MKAKAVISLAAITAVVTVGAVAAVYDRYQTQGVGRLDEPMIPGLVERANEVTTLTIKDAKGSFTLSKAASGWVLPEKGGYPVAEDKVRKAIVDLAKLRKTEEKTRRPDRYSRLQVEDPSSKDAKSILVAVKAGDRMLANVILGKQKFSTARQGDEGVYVRFPDKDQTWLASGASSISTDPLDWVDKSVVDIKEPRVTEIRVAPKGGDQVIAVRDETGKAFKLSNPPADKSPAKDAADKLRDLGGAFDGVQFEDVKKADAVAGKEPDVTITALTSDGVVLELNGFKDGDAEWFTVAASADDTAAAKPAAEPGAQPAANTPPAGAQAEAAAIGKETKGWLYKLPESKVKSMTPQLATLVQ